MPRPSIVLAVLVTLGLLSACVPLSPGPGVSARETASPGAAESALITPSANCARSAASPEGAYRAYFEALATNDFDRAVGCISDYSLQVEGLTREGVRSQYKMGMFGALHFLELQIDDVRYVSPTTAVIHDHVTFQQALTPVTTREQWNSARLENGAWRVNAGDLVDSARVDLPARTSHGVSVSLGSIRRYTTKTRLVFEVRNGNGRPVWWGDKRTPGLVIHVADRLISAADTAPLRFDRASAYPQIYVEVGQWLDSYPTEVDLNAWSLVEGAATETPDPQAQAWSYAFRLKSLRIQ